MSIFLQMDKSHLIQHKKSNNFLKKIIKKMIITLIINKITKKKIVKKEIKKNFYIKE